MTEKMKAKAKSCFVICPIGSDKSSSRARSNQILKYVIKPILEAANYRVERADQLAEPGMITNQIVKKIVDCDILIADLSEANPNVFYELAIRHGLKRPFVHMIDAAEKIPFDNAQVRTIQIDIKDLDSVDAAKRQLQAQVETIEQGDSVAESPISIAFDLEALKAGGSDDSGVMSLMLDQLMALNRDVRSLKAGIQRTTKDVRINDVADLLQLLFESGHKPLLDLVEKFVSYASSHSQNLTIETSLNPDAERDLMNDLASFLTQHSGKQWTVDGIPF